jgi:hypothetical protein
MVFQLVRYGMQVSSMQAFASYVDDTLPVLSALQRPVNQVGADGGE